MTADVFCVRIITNDKSLSVKDNIHDVCFQYQIQGQNIPILVYSRVIGRKYIYMGLSYKYTENDQVQVRAFFKYSVVHYKYI